MTDGAAESLRVALLRGINVGGRNRLAMADLRSLCGDLGMTDVETYIQSGNVVFVSGLDTTELEDRLEAGIADRFGISISVLVRSADEWRSYFTSNPFQDESRREPNLVMLALSKSALPSGAAERLSERADTGERIVAAGGALWLHFPSGAGRSRLSPGLIDRLSGSPTTTRNWLTVRRIAEMMGIDPAAG